MFNVEAHAKHRRMAYTQTFTVGTLTSTKSVFQMTNALGSLSTIRLPAQSSQPAFTFSHTPARRSKRRQPRHNEGKDIRRQEKKHLVLNSSSSGTEDGVVKKRPRDGVVINSRTRRRYSYVPAAPEGHCSGEIGRGHTAA